jgi:hypothetical protein
VAYHSLNYANSVFQHNTESIFVLQVAYAYEPFQPANNLHDAWKIRLWKNYFIISNTLYGLLCTTGFVRADIPSHNAEKNCDEQN